MDKKVKVFSKLRYALYTYLHYPEILTASSIQKIVLRNQDDSELDHPCQSPGSGPMKFHRRIRIQVFNIMYKLKSQDVEF